jgi:hypothetical protein
MVRSQKPVRSTPKGVLSTGETHAVETHSIIDAPLPCEGEPRQGFRAPLSGHDRTGDRRAAENSPAQFSARFQQARRNEYTLRIKTCLSGNTHRRPRGLVFCSRVNGSERDHRHGFTRLLRRMLPSFLKSWQACFISDAGHPIT